MGWTQIAFAMVVGRFLFGVDWGPYLWAVILLMAAYSGLVAWLGMLLGTLARTEGQVIGIGVLSANALGALGGCWWPIEVVPGWMQRLADFLPSGWAMDGLHKLMFFGKDPLTIAPHLAVMVAGSLLVAWFCAKRFRFQ